MLHIDIRKQLDEIKIIGRKDRRKVKCFCGEICNRSIVPHLRSAHPDNWREWGMSFIKLWNQGLSYYRIIKQFKTNDGRFLFTSRIVEREIQRLVEKEKIKLEIPRKEKIEEWQPKNAHINRETIWSFKDRGSWAVHQGDYRGNWSPHIPRTLIELYSTIRDIVLDPFVGGGTTLIETWLANRRGFGLDISPIAVATTKSRIQEMLEQSIGDPRVSLDENLKPVVIEGDSRKLKDHVKEFGVIDNSVKLVCAHPPYLDSLRYTATVEEDLSHIVDPVEFCDQLQLIAKQVFDLLTENGICAVLIGDVRKHKEVIPLGFLVMDRFLREDFRLKEIIIKAQHKDSSTRFYYTKRDKLDFLLGHEYLFIFGK
jgi:SAM-dependent methyltransferase